MQIGVIGAGAMGGLLAARLSLAGHDVQLVARGEHRDAIARDGLRVRGAMGDAIAQPRLVSALANVDVCLVCVKLQDSATAVQQHVAGIGSAPVVLVQNGIDGFALARKVVPENQLFGGISLIAANFTEPGLVTVTNPGPILIGRGSGAADEESERLARLLGDAVPTEAIDNFTGALWTKLVFNMLNAIPAITGRSVQEVGNDPWLARVPAAAMREAAQIGAASGVRFGRVAGIAPELIATIAEQPLAETVAFVRESAGDMGEVPNLASMLQSVRRGKATEVDFLNGAVVRVAADIGRQAPVNRALTVIVHSVERDGRHRSARQLRRALWRRGVWL